MWSLIAEIDSKKASGAWDIYFSPIEVINRCDLYIDFRFLSFDPMKHKDPQAELYSLFEWFRLRNGVSWLESTAGSWREMILNFDGLRTFVRTYFKDRQDVMCAHLFEQMSGRVRVNLGTTSGGISGPGMKSKDWMSIVIPIFDYHLEGITMSVPGPGYLGTSLMKFRTATTTFSSTAFIMMKFGDTRLHEEIVSAIKSILTSYNIGAFRADDRQYHDDLFENVQTYMYGCHFGIAVFERLLSNDFNPNVSLEVGFMMALGKPVCLLKDSTLKTLHTDLAGKLYKPFNTQNPIQSISTELKSWLNDKGLIQRTKRKKEKKRK